MDTTELAKRLIAIALTTSIASALSGCGVSMGESAWGTSGFMAEHNAKLRIIRGEGVPMDEHTPVEKQKLEDMIRRY